MWSKSFSKTYQNLTADQVCITWADVNNWHTYDLDIEWAKLEGPFATGNFFMLKPKGMSAFKIHLLEVIKHHKYVDCTQFFGAKMLGIHTMEQTSGGMRLTVTMQVTGWLSWLWIKLVAQGIVDGLEAQTDTLVEVARKR